MNQSNKIIIAIDGYSSCGKSTLAKELAKELHYVFIDSGAMYRGVTLYAIQNNLIHKSDIDRSGVIKALDKINLSFKFNTTSKSPELILNGTNVEELIRKPEVASFVSKIAVIKEVRNKLVAEQRKMGKNGGIVMDGRDIGSVVFPEAQLKLFVTADVNIRVERRHSELIEKGIKISSEAVESNLRERDRIDTTRKESPLIKTKDAIVIDNSKLSREEQLKVASNIVENKLSTLV